MCVEWGCLFFPSIIWVLGLNLEYQVWWQAPVTPEHKVSSESYSVYRDSRRVKDEPECYLVDKAGVWE